MRPAGLLAVLVALVGCSGGEREVSFEDQLQRYLETKSRYRHTLEWRGEIQRVTCNEPRMIPIARHARKREPTRFCDIDFAEVGVERWSVVGADSEALYLVPWGNRGNGVIAN
jgi:hypothetical protein